MKFGLSSDQKRKHFVSNTKKIKLQWRFEFTEIKDVVGRN